MKEVAMKTLKVAGLYFCIAALLVGVLYWRGAAASGHYLGMGQRVAGTYFGTAGADRVLFTIMADGGLVLTDTNNFGGAAGGLFGSSAHGSWERTGAREITIAAIELGFDVDGVHVLTFKAAGTLIFDKEFHRVEALAEIAVFTADQNPLDPDEAPIDLIPVVIEADRLPAE